MRTHFAHDGGFLAREIDDEGRELHDVGELRPGGGECSFQVEINLLGLRREVAFADKLGFLPTSSIVSSIWA